MVANVSGSNSNITPIEIAVGASIDAITSWRHRLLPPLLLGFVMLFDSWDSIVIAHTMPAIVKEFGFGHVVAGTLISVGYAGQLLGALAFGPVAERYGRLPILYFTIVCMSCLSLVCAFIPGVQALMVARFFQGMAIGGALPIAVTYINELAPAPIRGRYFAAFQFITMSGYTVASFVGMFVVPVHGWRPMFGIGAAPLLLLPLVALTLPESPRWLARRGRIEAANRALGRLGGRRVEPAIAETPSADRSPMNRERTTPLALFDRTFRNRTIALLLLWFPSSFIAFGIATWGPTIYTTFYGLSLATTLQYVTISNFCYLVAAPLSASFIDTLGRRRPSIFWSVIALTALSSLVLVRPESAIATVVLLSVSSVSISAMVSMILWPYTAENYPTRIRATALGFFSAMNRLPPMIVPIIIGAVTAATHSIAPIFGLFAACALIITLVWIFFTRETARQSLEEIESNGTGPDEA